MNLNPEIISLKDIVGYPVKQDRYVGDAEKYIVFTYEDERVEDHADNKPISDTAQLQISFFTPENYNYFSDKKKIKEYLESKDYSVSCRAYLEDMWHEAENTLGPEKIRRVLFNATKTEMRIGG